MRIFNTIILILLILLFSGEAVAGGYNVSGVGMKALSMGGAFRAVADDWSAMYYNPAGLSNLYQHEIAFGIDLYSYRPEFTPQMTLNDYSFGYYDGEERVSEDKIPYTPFAAAAFVLPIFENVNVGFGVFQPYDHDVEWNVFRLSPVYNQYVVDSFELPVVEPLVPFPDITHEFNVDIIDFHPTVAAELIEDKMSLGVGLSIRKGSYNRSEIILQPNTLPELFSSRPYENLVTMTKYDASGWGFGFNAGLLYQATEKLKVGASYQSKTTIDLSGDADATLYSPGNRHMETLADTANPAKQLFKGEIYTASHEADADWVIPSEFGFGLSYQATERVMLSADFVYTMWSEYEGIKFDVTRTTGLTEFSFINGYLSPTDMPDEWDDAFRISVGVEGHPHERYKLRGGYSFEQTPIAEEGARVIYDNPSDRHHLSGGASLYVGIVEFYGAASLIIAPETTVSNLVDDDEDGVFDNHAGTYNDFTAVTSIGFTVRF
jgi:long-chain fatty acid transport protein